MEKQKEGFRVEDNVKKIQIELKEKLSFLFDKYLTNLREVQSVFFVDNKIPYHIIAEFEAFQITYYSENESFLFSNLTLFSEYEKGFYPEEKVKEVFKSYHPFMVFFEGRFDSEDLVRECIRLTMELQHNILEDTKKNISIYCEDNDIDIQRFRSYITGAYRDNEFVERKDFLFYLLLQIHSMENVEFELPYEFNNCINLMPNLYNFELQSLFGLPLHKMKLKINKEKIKEYFFPYIIKDDLEKGFLTEMKIIELSALVGGELNSFSIILSKNFICSEASKNFRETTIEKQLLKNLYFFPKDFLFKGSVAFCILTLSNKPVKSVSILDLNYLSVEDILNSSYEDFHDFPKNIYNEVEMVEFGEYLLNIDKLKYHKYMNIDQNEIIKLSELIYFDGSKLEPQDHFNMLNLDIQKTSDLEYFTNMNSQKFKIRRNKHSNSKCYLLDEGYLYLNLLDDQLNPKLFKIDHIIGLEYIDSSYVPFKLINNQKVLIQFLLHFLKLIDVKKYKVDNGVNEMSLNFAEHIYIPAPSEVDQLRFVNKVISSHYVKFYDKSISSLELNRNELQDATDAFEHAIKSPISDFKQSSKNIKNILEEAKKNGFTDKYFEMLNKTSEIIERSSDTVSDNVRDYANKAMIEVVPEKILVNDIFEEYCSKWWEVNNETKWKDKTISFSFNCYNNIQHNKVFIKGDKRKIMNIFQNLEDNVFRHAFTNCSHKYKMNLDLNIYDDNIVFSLFNSGSPMDKTISDDKFGEKVSTHKDGTGEGGRYIKAIMDLHNGSFNIKRLNNKYSQEEYVTRINLIFKKEF